jgi:hypothetical protein
MDNGDVGKIGVVSMVLAHDFIEGDNFEFLVKMNSPERHWSAWFFEDQLELAEESYIRWQEVGF